MSRLRFNNQGGTITDNPLTSGATTMNSAALANFPAVVAPGYAAIILEPDTANEEVVWIMAHTASATSATIWRARESPSFGAGYVAVAHASGSRWTHGPTAIDLPATGQSAFIYSPPGFDDAIIQAIYNQGTTPALITVIGESIATGMESSNYITNGWFGRFETALLAKTGNTKASEYFCVELSQSFFDSIASSQWPATPPWVFGTSVGTSTAIGSGSPGTLTDTTKRWSTNSMVGALIVAGGKSMTVASNTATVLTGTAAWTGGAPTNPVAYVAVAATIEPTWGNGNGYTHTPNYSGVTVMEFNFTFPSAATGCEIVYLDIGGGNWKYSIDGAAAVTITNTSTSRQKKVTITGLSNAVHVIQFTDQSADSTCLIMGVNVVYATTGIGFSRITYPGAMMGDWVRRDQNPADKISQLSGILPATFGAPTAPHLLIIQMGANDANSSGDFYNPADFVRALDPSSLEQGFRRMIQAVRAARQANGSCSIIFIIPNIPDGVNSDVSAAGTLVNAADWQYWLDTIYQASNDYNCAVVNFQPAWGEFGVALGYQTALNLHPTTTGHQNMSDVISTLMP